MLLAERIEDDTIEDDTIEDDTIEDDTIEASGMMVVFYGDKTLAL